MTDDELRAVRDHIFAGEDRELYLHISYFLTWYAQVEWRLTILMATVAQEPDLDAFHLLVMGMDGKTKVRRFRGLCRIKKREIGPALSTRLAVFHNKLCPLRDRIAHTALSGGKNDGRFYFSTIDRDLSAALGTSRIKGVQPADRIERLTLFEHGLWMNYFAQDLAAVWERARAGQSLEVETPRSPPPKGDLANPPDTDAQTKSDTRDQTPPETQD